MIERLALVAGIILVAFVVGRLVTRRDGHVVVSEQGVSSTDVSSTDVSSKDVSSSAVPSKIVSSRKSTQQLSSQQLSSLGLPVVDVPHRAVLFGSPTCGPCDAVKRVLLQVESDRGDFTWRYVDTGDHLEVAEHLGIRRVPTLVVVDGSGLVRARTSGVPAQGDLDRVLDGGQTASVG